LLFKVNTGKRFIRSATFGNVRQSSATFGNLRQKTK
jgi:hypothetical protein